MPELKLISFPLACHTAILARAVPDQEGQLWQEAVISLATAMKG